jgi:hypothetical protein
MINQSVGQWQVMWSTPMGRQKAVFLEDGELSIAY